jgi:MFS family permease
MVAKYRTVFAVPGSPGLILSVLIGRLPLGMGSLAILLLVRGAENSYAIAGLAVGAYSFASAAAAPLQGRLVDGFGRRNVLAPFALAQATFLIALVIAASAHAGGAVLVPIAAAAGALMPPVSPTARALMREVYTEPGVLDTAYALDSVLQEIVWTTGPLVVALIVAAASPRVAVLVLAAVAIVGTGLFVRSPLARDRGRRTGHRERGSVLGNRELRALLWPVALMGIGLGCTEVGLPSLALHAGSRPASGLLLSVWSVGSIVGGLSYGARVWTTPIDRRYRLLLLSGVVCYAPLIFARSIPAGLVGSLLAGLAIAPVFSSQYTLVGRAVRPGTENEAFTWVSAALVGGLALGSALGGASIGVGGVAAPFELSCLAAAVAGAIAIMTGAGRIADRSHERSEERQLGLREGAGECLESATAVLEGE